MAPAARDLSQLARLAGRPFILMVTLVDVASGSKQQAGSEIDLGFVKGAAQQRKDVIEKDAGNQSGSRSLRMSRMMSSLTPSSKQGLVVAAGQPDRGRPVLVEPVARSPVGRLASAERAYGRKPLLQAGLERERPLTASGTGWRSGGLRDFDRRRVHVLAFGRLRARVLRRFRPATPNFKDLSAVIVVYPGRDPAVVVAEERGDLTGVVLMHVVRVVEMRPSWWAVDLEFVVDRGHGPPKQPICR